MTDYALYYWPVPFRGQFIRAILAFAGKTWTEHDGADLAKVMGAEPAQQPVPFMGPPVLVDKATKFALSEMPAIAFYLGKTLKLLPSSVEGQAMTVKVVNDANDVIDEITLDGGREMWTPAKWEEFVPRLKRWMAIFEALGTRHDLRPNKGFLLGGRKPGVADIITATLWSTMRDRFPRIGEILDGEAPRIAGLSRRMQAMPALAALAKTSEKRYGSAYCGGQIEASLRKVVGSD